MEKNVWNSNGYRLMEPSTQHGKENDAHSDRPDPEPSLTGSLLVALGLAIGVNKVTSSSFNLQIQRW